MKTKQIVTVVLLGFVALSVVALVIKEIRARSVVSVSPQTPTETQETPAALATQQTKVIAYYFHGAYRCVTCLGIERQAKQSIESTFASDLRDQRLVFQSVNVEEAPNRHFVQDYQLETRSLVLVQFKEGKPARWKTLNEVWTLVRDPQRFHEYVQNEVAQFLQEVR